MPLRPHPRSVFAAASSALIVILVVAHAAARPVAQNGGPSVEPSPEEVTRIVRIALSASAQRSISEARMRRLVEIHLGGLADVPVEPAGPLDENAVRVFVDLPQPTVVRVQVRGPGRALDVRRVDVAGLPWEVATRFVAIATSESVRAQLAPPRKRRPRAPTDEEIVAQLAAKASVELGAALVGAFVSDADVGLFGARARVSFHQSALSETITLTSMGATTGGNWLEIGVVASHRLWLVPELRLDLGLGFAVASVNDLRPLEEGETHPWIRGHGVAELDIRLGEEGAWLSASVEPGIAYDAHRERVGFYAGGTLAIAYDAPL